MKFVELSTDPFCYHEGIKTCSRLFFQLASCVHDDVTWSASFLHFFLKMRLSSAAFICPDHFLSLSNEIQSHNAEWYDDTKQILSSGFQLKLTFCERALTTVSEHELDLCSQAQPAIVKWLICNSLIWLPISPHPLTDVFFVVFFTLPPVTIYSSCS